jgi:DNA-binding GntR family transcriptional regulator
MAFVEEDRKKNLSETAYHALLDSLIRREIPIGTVLQERRIAEKLSMSRTPVREALNRLASEGFVTRKTGGVLIVREFSTREFMETLHVRQLLEIESVRLACGKIPVVELNELEAAIHDLLATQGVDADKDWAVDSRLHGLIAEWSGNTVLAKHINDLRLKTHMFDMNRVPERFEIGHREHLVIIDALRRDDSEEAREGVKIHIENVKKSILEKLRFG